MKRVLSGTWGIFLLYLLLTGLWLSPMVQNIARVPFQPGAQYSDLLISHLANSEFIHRALLTWREIPLWNPTFLSGMPLAADPLSGFWYPPNWISHLWPSPLTYNLLVWFHVAWLGVGMFRLAQSEGLGGLAAGVCGGLATGMPKLMGHIGLGHVGLVFALAWTPWMLLPIQPALSNSSAGGPRLRWSLTAGGVLGLIGLIDPRWLPFAAALGLGYALWLWGPWKAAAWRRWKAIVSSGLLGVAAGGIVAAGSALPLLELTRLSTRGSLTMGERAAFSLSPIKLMGLALPEPGGYAEGLVYFGVITALLAAIGLMARTRRVLFWTAVASGALIFALGENTPLFGWISSWIPGMDLLRVPTRSIFLLGIAMAFMAGHGFDVWLRADWRGGALKRARLAVVGLALFIFALASGAAVLTVSGGPGGLLFVSSVAVIGAAVLLLGTRGEVPSQWKWLFVLGLAALDLAWIGSTLIEMRPYRPEGNSIIELPESCASTTTGRLLSPSYSVPQILAARRGWELADGVNPLQLESYRQYMSKTMGFEADSYSVTLPPFSEGDPRADWHPELDVRALARLNVTCVISAYPLQAEGLSLLTVDSGRYFYALTTPGARAWMRDQVGGEGAKVMDLDLSPNRIGLRVQGPGKLILSEIAYPGWQARVDGESAAIETSFDLLRSVYVPAGDHTVEFTFTPWTVLAGAALTIIGGLSILGLWMRR